MVGGAVLSIDRTQYATIYFRAPEVLPAKLREILPKEVADALLDSLKDVAIDAPNMAERWQAAIEAIGK